MYLHTHVTRSIFAIELYRLFIKKLKELNLPVIAFMIDLNNDALSKLSFPAGIGTHYYVICRYMQEISLTLCALYAIENNFQ